MRRQLVGTVVALAFLGVAVTAKAAPITYVDLDGTSFGSGAVVFGAPSIIAPSNLDGSAFSFVVGDQMRWSRGAAPESSTHYVAFDYFAAANSGANITFFLDVPSILRFDLAATGRHHVDLYFNLATQTIEALVDGVLDASIISITAWPATPVSNAIRIYNQSVGPGNSTGAFEIDNLLWQGNVVRDVPEPPALILFGAVVLALFAFGRRRKMV